MLFFPFPFSHVSFLLCHFIFPPCLLSSICLLLMNFLLSVTLKSACATVFNCCGGLCGGRGEQFPSQSIGGSRTLGLARRPCACFTGLVIVCRALHTCPHCLSHTLRVSLCLNCCKSSDSHLAFSSFSPKKCARASLCMCVGSLSQAAERTTVDVVYLPTSSLLVHVNHKRQQIT